MRVASEQAKGEKYSFMGGYLFGRLPASDECDQRSVVLPAMRDTHTNSSRAESGAAAARNGRLDILEWLRLQEAPMGTLTCSAAASAGKLEALQWAIAHGLCWNDQTCAQAAYGGHLGLLQWARSRDAPWSSLTCRNAAYAGHLDVLRWARENGCAWSKKECLAVARPEEMRNWIAQQPA